MEAPTPQSAQDTTIACNPIQLNALKTAANILFNERKYAKAVVAYSKALQVSPTSAVLLANRALAHLHLENYASAFDDSSLAIRLDPGYVKGYYRRGSSNFILGKFGSALKDFEKVVQLQPRNLEGKKKVRECELALRKQRFEYAIRVPEIVLVKVSDSIELDTITVENTYDGPRLGENHTVTANFVKDMILQFKNCKAIHLRYAYEILLQTKSILEKVPSVIDVDIPEGKHITVCGDIHGQFFDLCNIFELNGEPSEDNPYLFNGDFVDRGSFSVEVVLTLFAFMCLCPESLRLIRGNHETSAMNKLYGFDGEVRAKYNGKLADLFQEIFCCLPLVASYHLI